MARSSDGGIIAGLFMVIAGLTRMAAWVTHVIWIIMTLASATSPATIVQMVLGAIGVFMPPVGVIHGFMIWFGAGL